MYYIHTDHLNTPRRISDNQIVWRLDNDPFGRHTANEDPDGDSQLFSFSLRYPGQYYDEETGLHYNYYRDYDPSTGRYIQSDLIGLDGGLNTYGYAGGNPISNCDAYGLWWDSIGVNLTFITDGKGTSTSFALASDGNGLYCVVTYQELDGTGYFYAGGGEAALGTGELMPDDTELFESSSSRDDVQGVAGGLTNPIKVKGTFGFSGGITESDGEISGAKGRRGLGVGGFTGEVTSQEKYKVKILPDYKLWD